MHEPRAIIFDLDDTLYPHSQFVASGFNAVARYLADTRQLPASEVLREMVRTPRGREFQAVCARFALGDAHAAELVDVYRRHTPRLQLAHAAIRMMEALRGDWRIGVLTNGDPAVQARKIAALRVDRWCDAVVFAAQHAEGGKPHLAPFLEALRRLAVPPWRAVHVGDDPVNDVAGGRRAGLRTVHLLTWTAATPARDAGADAVVRRFEDVPAAAGRLVEGAYVKVA